MSKTLSLIRLCVLVGNCVLLLALCAVCSTSLAAEHDYYRDMPYRPMLVPGVGLDRVEQAGGPDTTNYERRTVKWWPRKGQDSLENYEYAQELIDEVGRY